MKKYRNFIFSFAAVIFLAVAVFGYLMYNKPHRNIQKAQADYNITAIALMNEFETNSTLAIEKYVEKILLVSGKVESVSVTPSNTSIQLSCEGSFFGINCSFNSNGSSSLLGIKVRSEIQVKGECKGYIDDVILTNCFLLDNDDKTKKTFIDSGCLNFFVWQLYLP